MHKHHHDESMLSHHTSISSSIQARDEEKNKEKIENEKNEEDKKEGEEGEENKEDSIFFKGIDYKIEDSNIKPHQFNIEFEDGKYYIKDCKEGNGIFLKINPKLLINENNNKLIFMFNSLLILKTELKIMTMKFIIYYKNKRFKYDLNEKKIIITK